MCTELYVIRKQMEILQVSINIVNFFLFINISIKKLSFHFQYKKFQILRIFACNRFIHKT